MATLNIAWNPLYHLLNFIVSSLVSREWEILLKNWPKMASAWFKGYKNFIYRCKAIKGKSYNDSNIVKVNKLALKLFLKNVGIY